MQQKCNEEKLQYQRQRRAELKAKGLCVACGATPPEKGTMCEECKAHKKAGRNLNKAREYSARARKKRKALGICSLCPEPAVKGQVLCERHRKAKAEYNRRYYQKTPGRTVTALQPATLPPIVVDFDKQPWWMSFNYETSVTVWELEEVRNGND